MVRDKTIIEQVSEDTERKASFLREMRRDVIEETEMLKETCSYPFKIIFSKDGKEASGSKKYATYLEIYEPGKNPYRIWGHYFTDICQASQDFESRSEEARRGAMSCPIR